MRSTDSTCVAKAIHLNDEKSVSKGQGLRQGQALEFIIAVPGRRYAEFASLLGDFQALCTHTSTEIVGE